MRERSVRIGMGLMSLVKMSSHADYNCINRKDMTGVKCDTNFSFCGFVDFTTCLSYKLAQVHSSTHVNLQAQLEFLALLVSLVLVHIDSYSHIIYVHFENLNIKHECELRQCSKYSS